ncbi:GNAT family N-acetyltransferase [Shewanella surugensis]|uniref:GNAT family N-acetyltransferase n=1 Tax=Shewanella surugensis TaxID=212020 RepID=A0ABT0LAN9_9GAMM|nr:GNAT family N-acetyltransferase [Shewanella surugensis]MCL1124739.1 GNAT family N-acetyltransferase [Shewanella surugensis]
MYQVVEQIASVDDFIRLRHVSGLSPRLYEAVEKGLPNSLFGVQIVINDLTVGMGRVVGDGALNFDIVDIAVEPEHQRKGLGRLIMQSIMDYLEREALPRAYITLMADVPELYKKFGFQLSRPESEGMYLIK